MWFWWNFLNSLNLVLSKWQLLVQAGDKDFMRIMTNTSFSAGFILYKILFITFGIYYCKLYRILLNSFGTCRWKTLLVILDVDSQLELLTDCLMCMTYPLVNIMVFSFKIFARQKTRFEATCWLPNLYDLSISCCQVSSALPTEMLHDDFLTWKGFPLELFEWNQLVTLVFSTWASNVELSCFLFH